MARPLPRAVLLGLTALTALLALTAAATFPATADLPPGWRTPIIAFELARNAEDLAFVTGPEHETIRAAMDAGHRVDMVFPLAYGGLIGVSAWTVGVPWLRRLGMAAAVLAICGDYAENTVLLRITEVLRAGGSADAWLWPLYVATWAKWTCIATALCVVGWAERQRRILALALAISGPATAIAAWTGAPMLGEAMAASVALGLLALGYRAWTMEAQATP